MTVGELIKTLSMVDDNANVVFSFSELLPDNTRKEHEVNSVSIKDNLSNSIDNHTLAFQCSNQILKEEYLLISKDA